MSDEHLETIDRALMDTLRPISLDQKQVTHLLNMQNRVEQQSFLQQDLSASVKSQQGLKRGRWLIYTSAISFCASLALFFSLVIWPALFLPNYSQEIASEVVKNHLKLKPLDVTSHSFNDLRVYFSDLDFSPINSLFHKAGSSGGSIAQPSLSLVGGRYCSVRGAIAAQLRYRDARDSVSTLYQAAYDKKQHGRIPDKNQRPFLVESKGLDVTLWKEKGVLMVLVTQD